jgi:LPXTG-motif cell wall-anchored protein
MLGVLDIQRVTIKHKIILATLLLLGVFMFGSGRAHAATLTVGPDCSIGGAITSINDGADHDSCTSTGTYGANDIVDIPAGIHTLTGDLTTLTVPATIQGAGMGQTIIDGDAGQYRGFNVDTVDEVTIKDLTVTAFHRFGISSLKTNLTLSNIEIDGTDCLAQSNNIFGIFVQNDDAGTFTLDSNNVYIHDINVVSGTVNAFVVDQKGGGTTNATIQNTTVANLSNQYVNGGVNGIALTVGLWNGTGSTGTLNTVISNTTVANIIAENQISGPFSSLAFSSGGTATVNTTVYNVTVTGTRGITATTPPLAGVKSGAFYAASVGLGGGSAANVSVEVGNSLLADNLSDTSSSNCVATDLTPNFSGSGSGAATITSLDYNISDDASCTQFTEPHDQQNIDNIISTLGPLQNNGGTVPTMALLAGSPAIGAGGAVLGITTDARGVARTNGWDVGAYQTNLGASTDTPSGSSGGAGNLANTGQNSKTSILVGLVLVSGVTAVAITRRKAVYKRH